MDRMVNVRFFSIESEDENETPFSHALEAIYKLPLAQREHEIDTEITIRLERLQKINTNVIAGEIVRIQSSNLPPKALSGQPVDKLGVASIGHVSAFRYNIKQSILAMETGRSGITHHRLTMYVKHFAKVTGYGAWPVLTENAWQKLADNRVRKVMVKVASPEKLAATTAKNENVKNALKQMKAAANTTYVEAVFGMGHSQNDISHSFARNLFKWMLGEKEKGEADIAKLSAEIKKEDEKQNELLSFLQGHLGDKKSIELPDDDPNTSYSRRDNYINSLMSTFKRELDKQFG